jgi:hypothetical protein
MLFGPGRGRGRTPPERRIGSLKEHFRFDPGTTEAAIALRVTDDEAIRMEALTVTGSILRRHLARSVDAHSQRIKDAQFTWTKGGLLRSYDKGSKQIELGLWPKLEHENYGTELAPMLRMKVLQINW